jgi:hypothetical protein
LISKCLTQYFYHFLEEFCRATISPDLALMAPLSA